MRAPHLGGYKLEALAGRGAMGEVWRATHAATGLEVAIKVVPAQDSPLAALLFASEVRAAAALHHPCVVHILDQGRLDDGRGWLALEWCGDGTLDDARVSSWAEAHDAVASILRGLGHAHASGVLHRDVKPANVLRAGAAWKLGDFGVARVGSQRARHVVGTPAYLPPEQARGQAEAQGPWSDIYSTGCVVWRLVTGRPPFLGDPVALLRAHQQAALPRLTPVMPVPAGLEDWLHWVLHKEPERRPAFAAVALDGLRALGQPRGASAPRPRAVHEVRPSPSMVERTFSFEGDEEGPLPPPPVHAVTTLPLPERRPDDPPAADRRLRDVGLGLVPHRVAPFVGRAGALDRVWEALRGVTETGRPRVVVLEGPRGSGRRRLAREVGRAAHAAGAARWADARDLDRPVTSASVRAWSGGGPAVVRVDATSEPDLLESILRVHAPVLWILTVDEAPPALGAPHVERVTLAPLEAADIRLLVHGVLPLAPAATAALVEHAGGLPGAALDQLHAWLRSGRLARTPLGFEVGPATIAPEPELGPGLLEAWLEHRSHPAQAVGNAVLELLAVFRGEATVEALTRAGAAAGIDDTWAHLQQLIEEGRLMLTRAAGHASVSLVDRTQADGLRAAASARGRLRPLAEGALEALPHTDPRMGRILFDAQRWWEAARRLDVESILLQGHGEDAQALQLRRLALDACRRVAPPDAPLLWGCRLRLARSLRELAYLDEATTLLDEWRAELDRADAHDAARFHTERANLYRTRGALEHAVREIDRALSLLRSDPPPEASDLAYLLRVSGDVLLFAGQASRALALLDEAATLIAPDSNEWGWTNFTRGRARVAVGQVEEGYALLTEVCRFSERKPWTLLRATANAQAGETAVKLGRLDAAQEHYRVSSRAYRGAERDEACILELNLAVLCLRRAQWDEAAAIATRLRHDPRVSRLILARLAVEQIAGVAAAGRGDWAAHREHTERLLELASQHPALADPDLVLVQDLAIELATQGGQPAERALAEHARAVFAARQRA